MLLLSKFRQISSPTLEDRIIFIEFIPYLFTGCSKTLPVQDNIESIIFRFIVKES